MMWEMFGNAPTPPDNRAWGRGQAIRPGIQVESVVKTVAELRDRNVEFEGDIQQREWGEFIELIAAEGTRWTVGNARRLPYGEGVRMSHIGWVEIKVVDLDAQVAFYRDVMRLETVFHKPDEAMLRQGKGEPVILIRLGGEKTSTDLFRPGPLLRQHPVWISFMISDPDGVAAWFEQNNVPVLRPLTSHPEWGGVDILIADVDGNPIQAVRYTFIG